MPLGMSTTNHEPALESGLISFNPYTIEEGSRFWGHHPPLHLDLRSGFDKIQHLIHLGKSQGRDRIRTAVVDGYATCGLIV